VSARTKQIMALLTAEAEQRPRWDEYPVLYRLHQRGGAHRLVDLGIAPETWEKAETQTVLTSLALLIMAGNYRPPPGDPEGELAGMAFRTEAWDVETEPGDHFGMHRMNKMSGEGRLWQHPGRVEVRMAIAVDRHGVTYQAKHRRGGDTEQLVMLPGRGELQASGAIVEALDVMVATLTGAGLPTRPSPYAHTTEGMN
jgi:hypothetical protein